MTGNLWILAEQWRGQVSEITYEVLALGREVASGLGVHLQAVLLGHNAQGMAATLGEADTVLYVDHPTLAEPTPESYTQALTQLVKEKHPQSLLIPLTNLSMDLGSLLAAQLNVTFVNFCKDVRVTDGALEAQCVLYGGKMEATVAAAEKPTIFGVLPGARPAEKGRAEGMPSIVEVAVSLPDTPKVRFKKYIEPEAGDVDITQQDVLVAVGRGIQSPDNLELAEELAAALGGAVCGSRPVIDQGWLPLTRQVGKSGANVKPKLYLAAGISGAPEHVEGMKNAALIVAINTDPQAPIFHVAHYGIVADALDVLPALTEAVRAQRERKAPAAP
jgi:electron transfer flavoprotein alpha subunit